MGKYVKPDVYGAMIISLMNQTMLIIKENSYPRELQRLGIPKGKIKPGESREECINREIMEEVGIDLNQGIIRFPLNNRVDIVYFWAEPYVTKGSEIERYKWVSLAQVPLYGLEFNRFYRRNISYYKNHEDKIKQRLLDEIKSLLNTEDNTWSRVFYRRSKSGKNKSDEDKLNSGKKCSNRGDINKSWRSAVEINKLDIVRCNSSIDKQDRGEICSLKNIVPVLNTKIGEKWLKRRCLNGNKDNHIVNEDMNYSKYIPATGDSVVISEVVAVTN